MAAALVLAGSATSAAAVKRERAQKVVYLTFDDGPNRGNDVPLLRILRKEQVPATFFLVGSSLAEDRDAAAELFLAGHAVGNHTYSHADLTALDFAGVSHQLRWTQQMLGRVGGKCMRPPYGAVNGTVGAASRQLGLTQVMWSVDPQDWAHQNTGYIVSHVLTHVQDHSVVLLHDGGGDRSATVAAVRQLIPLLRERGYDFRTVPACRVPPVVGRAVGLAKVKAPPKPDPSPVPTLPPSPTPVPTPTVSA